MATLFGNTGSVTVGATGIKISVTQWQCALEIDAATAPAAFGEKWEESALTVGRVTGSLTGKILYNVAASKPFDPSVAGSWSNFSGSAELIAATGTDCKIAGTFIYSNVSITHSRAGAAEMTCTFRSSGSDVAVTWDEA